MTYSGLNISPASSEKPPEAYQKFYLMTPKGEKELADKLQGDPEQVAACRKRLEELELLLKHDDNRCHISRDQRNYLRKMMAIYGK
jgi:hypothetical protein